MLENSGVLVVNLLGPIISEFELLDKNCIKVVCDLYNNALYFSRQAIHPWSTPQRRNIGKQVCIIPFQRDFLLEYSRLEPTPLEIIESIDMLRVLEHGGNVRMVPTIYDTHAVDTKEDLQRVEVLMSTVN
jgi:3-deoxy-manno-octulosonate cytidylyltransferase (CMP-KDO synthetase)